MIRGLLVVIILLLVRRAVATTCTIDSIYGELTLPEQIEPAVTSFCHKALETTPSKAIDHPPLLLSLPASRELSSFCSCVLDHLPTSTKKTLNAPPTKTYTKTLTVSITQSCRIVTATTKSITVSKIAPTATVTITTSVSARTITISAIPTTAITTTSKTSSKSTPSIVPTGPPACTQAANPSGTCAYAADYNSGTAPQLWAGAAASLEACALLCTGEPGCLSLAYNPSGTLQCILFITVTGGLTTTSDASSSTILYDSTCFACSGVPPRPPTDDGCTPALQPPGSSICGFNAIYAGATLFVISASGNTASSLGACAQECLSLPACQSFSFDGTNCQLYSTAVIQLELGGLAFPVNPGVAGSTIFYDRGCLVCPNLGCACPSQAGKRSLVRRQIEVERREASLKRREAELERRKLVLEDRERSLIGSG